MIKLIMDIKNTYYLYTINFKDLTGTSPIIHTRNPDKRTNKVYQTIAFKSLRYTSLNYYYDLFYNYDETSKRYKVVPYNIKELLNARALAYWIRVDGGIDSFKATLLNTYSFNLNDINLLQAALKENFYLISRPLPRPPLKKKEPYSSGISYFFF